MIFRSLARNVTRPQRKTAAAIICIAAVVGIIGAGFVRPIGLRIVSGIIGLNDDIYFFNNR